MEIVELAKAFAKEQALWPYIFIVGMFSPHWKETSGEILKISTKRIFYKRLKRQFINKEKFLS